MIALATTVLIVALAAAAVSWALRAPEPATPAHAPSAKATREQLEDDGVAGIEAKSLAFDGLVTRHLFSTPVIAVETGEPPFLERLRDLPRDEADEHGNVDLAHSTRGWLCGVVDLVQNPDRFGFAPGAPVRYWSPLPPEPRHLGAPLNPNLTKMALFEIEQDDTFKALRAKIEADAKVLAEKYARYEAEQRAKAAKAMQQTSV